MHKFGDEDRKDGSAEEGRGNERFIPPCVAGRIAGERETWAGGGSGRREEPDERLWKREAGAGGGSWRREEASLTSWE